MERTTLPLPVIDFHCHFPVKGDDVFGDYWQEYTSRYGEEKAAWWQRAGERCQAEWREAWGFPAPEPVPSDPAVTAARWVNETLRYGLERVVFVTGGGNRKLAGVVSACPDRLIGFAHHNPFAANAAAELERAVVQDGLQGYKIFAPLLPKPLDSQELIPLWQVAEKHRLPVLIHFGILGGGGGIAAGPNLDPLALHHVAKAYPGIPFIVPHFGCGYPRELLMLCWACPNVHVDTSGNNEWMRWMPYPLTLQDLFQRFYETVGPARIIFGSDSAWFPRGFAARYFWDQWRACCHLRIPEGDRRLIFRDNAARLLKLNAEEV